MLDEVYGKHLEYMKEQLVDNPVGKGGRAWGQARLIDWLKTSSGCSSCGYNEHPSALDFHHIDESTKTAAVSSMVRNRLPVADIAAEVDKCIVLCANCHRIFHATNIDAEERGGE